MYSVMTKLMATACIDAFVLF